MSMGHQANMQCCPHHSSYLVIECDDKRNPCCWTSSGEASIANSLSFSSSSNAGRQVNCNSNAEFHKLLDLHLRRLLRLSKNTVSTRRGLKKHKLTLKAEQLRLNKQNALPGLANKEKSLLLMRKEPSAASSIVPMAARPLSNVMHAAQSSNPRKISISSRTNSEQSPRSHHPSSSSRQLHNNNICPCAGESSSENLPRQVSFAVHAHKSKPDEIDVEIGEPLFDNEFIISEDDSFFYDDVPREGNSPHVELFQSQFF